MQQMFEFGRRLSRGAAGAAAARLAVVRDAENPSTTPRLTHQLHFASLFDASRSLSFPCDGSGEVQLDRLNERARNNYFFARNARHDYGPPIVIALENDSKTH